MSATRTTLRAWLPLGNTLDDEAFAERHLLLRLVLGFHIPALALFAFLRGVTPAGSAAAVVLPVVCVVAASVFRERRVRAVFVTAGLLWCSAALVHVSGGAMEAHFHFFIVVGLVALYQDWPPFLFAIAFSVLSNGIAGTVDPGSVSDHGGSPWPWALLEGAAIVLASAAQVLFWRATERSQAKAAALAADLVLAEEQSARRASVSELFVNLARRNQSLLDRQLALIDDLEQAERDPDALAELFKLDHLATRIRRNAESLLVLSGEEPARRWGAPVALAEVARAAVAEVEDFNRAVITVDEGVAVSGRAVADLAHLLAELVENATTFSPPTLPVHIRGRRTTDGRCLLMIEDRGIGMSQPELVAVNERLAAAPEADVELDRRLGFRVVARLAARYGVRVALAETPGGGITAVVSVPADLVASPGGFLADPPSLVDVAPPAATPAGPLGGAAPAAVPAAAAPAPVGAPSISALAPRPAPAAAAPAPVAPASTPALAPRIAPAAAAPAPAAPPSSPGPAPVVQASAATAPVVAPAAPAPVATPSLVPSADAVPGVRPPALPVRQPQVGAESTSPALPTRTPGTSAAPPPGPAMPAPPAAPATAPVAGAPEAPAAAAPVPAPGAPAPVAPAGAVSLPRRTPTATSWPAPPRPSVAGGLPDRQPGPAPRPQPVAPAAGRTPEQARLLLSRFQSGQVAGRTAADARRDDLAVSASTPTTPEEDR